MSMHLEGPWLNTSGKRKGKPKFRNAEAAAKARRNAESWAELLARYPVDKTKKTTRPISVKYDIIISSVC